MWSAPCLSRCALVATVERVPFGIKPGPRSLYYHARNAWLTMIKYAPLEDLLRMPWLVLSKIRWSLFCAATERQMRLNPDWAPFYAIAATDVPYAEKLVA